MDIPSGSHVAWWYGRAIRIYFGISLLISAMWLVKVAISTCPLDVSPTTAQPAAACPEHDLLPPTYRRASTDHIYCINAAARRGRNARMTELFTYLRLDAHMFNGSHIDAWRDMIKMGHKRALITEDDVDFEIDAVASIRAALASVDAKRSKWDILYVGHCSMDETQGQRVEKSVRPFCTSAYVVSRQGARRLVAYFSKHASAPHALDVQLVAMVKRKILRAYSVFPPVVFQRRDLYPSDDGMELRVARLFRNPAWNEALELVPRLANWADPPDMDHMHPAFQYIPKWMEHRPTVN
ncbi:hypothetical protein EV176_000707 [Coemansia sp. RSA 451]|nr:hypothetical protein EV176_000707 [Coemansia sp. RSA 451]KAJ2532478.1 hypothetical protein GGH20_001107 [Coemansia sp. RSA 1937]KAJ2554490.1 hypothetical protein IWW35_001253 [Coemansia sp. RSA 1878]